MADDHRNEEVAAGGHTARLARWISEFTLEQAPNQVIQRAKLLFLDGIGCALVGAKLPWSRRAVEAVTAFEGKGSAPVIGWGRSLSGPAATVLNSSFIQGFELDDFHPMAPLHSASLLIPALLSAADLESGVTGESLLRAAIVGFEVGPRVGLALHGSEMLSRGWHSGPVFGSIASAASVANYLGLDGDAVQDALGLGATQAGGLMAAQFGADSKRMQHGFAARNGYYAAQLAKAGYSGIKDVFEQPYGGYLSTFGEGYDPDVRQIDSELGTRWETLSIAIKPYAAMGGLHGAIDAIFDIASQRPLVANEISSIDVELSHTVYHHGWWLPERPLSPTAAQMNVAYSVAVAVLDGAALIDQYSPKRIDADDVWQIIPKVTAHHQTEFDAHSWGRGQTQIRIRFTDGQELESYQLAAKSVLEGPSRPSVISKFKQLTKDVIDRARSQELVETVLDLENVSEIGRLVELLAEPADEVF